MDPVEQAAKLIRLMSPPDKARVLAMVASDPDVAFAGIAVSPGVCGGAPRIAGTRIPVWLLQALRDDGATEQKLLEAYPNLTPVHLKNAWEFVAQNRALIDEEIAQNEAA